MTTMLVENYIMMLNMEELSREQFLDESLIPDALKNISARSFEAVKSKFSNAVKNKDVDGIKKLSKVVPKMSVKNAQSISATKVAPKAQEGIWGKNNLAYTGKTMDQVKGQLQPVMDGMKDTGVAAKDMNIKYSAAALVN